MNPTNVRTRLAHALLPPWQAEWGRDLVAAAIYGSVAHQAAEAHSDLEILLLTTDAVPSQEAYGSREGILVELDRLPLSQMLAAAERVGPDWGLEADQYRVFTPLWDPQHVLGEVRRRSLGVCSQAFAGPLRVSRFQLAELWGKLRNAEAAHDGTRVRDVGFLLARRAALTIALLDREPFASARTMWDDVRRRGYAMELLLDVLTQGEVSSVVPAAEAVVDRLARVHGPDEDLIQGLDFS